MNFLLYSTLQVEIAEKLPVPTGSSTSASLSMKSPVVHHLLQVRE